MILTSLKIGNKKRSFFSIYLELFLFFYFSLSHFYLFIYLETLQSTLIEHIGALDFSLQFHLFLLLLVVFEDLGSLLLNKATLKTCHNAGKIITPPFQC